MRHENAPVLARIDPETGSPQPRRTRVFPWLFRGLTAMLLGFTVLVFGGGSASADTITNSGDITIEVGQTATISWTYTNDDTDPNLCDGAGGSVVTVYSVSGQAGVTYVGPDGTRDTVNTPFIPAETPCVAGSSTQSFQVTGTSTGTRSFGVYRASANVGTGDNNANSYLTVTVVPAVNDPPVATPQSVSTDEDTPLAITLAGTDPDGDSLTYSVVGNPTLGILSGTAPNLTYTPNLNANGIDSFTFTVFDGTVTSAPATVTITVNPINDPPVANPDSLTTDEDTPLIFTVFDLIGNDTDVDGFIVNLRLASNVGNGTVGGNSDGSVTYTPNPNFNGTDTFIYVAIDGLVESAATTVTITVNPVPDPPVATAQTLTTDEDTPLAITLAGSDVDGDSLTYAVSGSPTRGTLSGTAPNLTYTPNANANGPDSFTFTVSDGTITSAPATVTIAVAAVNDPPVANSDSYTTNEDTPLGVAAPGVLSNDTDVDGNPIFDSFFDPAHGRLNVAGSGSFVYVPNLNFNGTDTFSYRVRDNARALSAFVTVTITVVPVNDPPVANGQTLTAAEDTPFAITLLGSDPDLESLTYLVATGPGQGTLSGTAPNLTYTPNANANGTDSFTFTASDGIATSAPATISITVSPVNDAPVASPDSYTTDEDTPLAVAAPGVLGNDTDVEGTPLVAVLLSDVSQGALTLNEDGSFSYVPRAGFNGIDSFRYGARENQSQGLSSNTTTVTITVNAVNDAPVASSQSVSTDEDTPLGITLSGGDSDGDALTYTVATGPVQGTLSGTAPELTYTPNPDANGPDSFTFTVSDGTATSVPATVGITITAVNDPPVATPQNVTTDEDMPLPIALAGTDPDGDSLTYAVVGNPTLGTLTGTAPNLTYTPNANATGPDSFTFTASDGTASSAPATVGITITAVNDPPTITDLDDITTEATGPTGATIIFIPPTATDIEDGSLTVTCAPPSGTLFPIGTTTVTCTATDSAGSGATSVFTITVTDATPPVITVPADITAEATSPAGASVPFIVSAVDATDGPVAVTCRIGDTVITSPRVFPLGTTTVTCTASDANGNAATATFTVRVRDTTGPSIRWIGGPQPGGIYTVANLPAAPTCEGIDLASPVIQCRVYGYQSGPGFWTLTARARDAEGNSAVATRTYRVVSGGTVPGATPTPRPTQPTATPTQPPTQPTAAPTRPPRGTSAPVQPTATPETPTATPVTPVVQPTSAPTRPPRR